MKISCFTATVIAVSVCSCAFGQVVQPGSTHDQLKDFQFFVGTWEIKGMLDGKEFTADVQAKWINKGNFLQESSAVKDPEMESNVIIGWNPSTKKLTSWGFGAWGGHGRLVWTKEGDKWHAKSEGPWIAWDGTEVLDTEVRTVTGKDSYDFEWTEVAGNTKSVMRATATRKSP